MPEGPEIETIRRDIEPLLVSQVISKIWVNPVFFKTKAQITAFKKLEGKTIHSLGRHGKLLWIDTAYDQSVLIRLGMTGRLHVQEKKQILEKHTHIRIEFENQKELRFIDPRRFGSFILSTHNNKNSEIARLGPDPFSWKESDFKNIIGRIQKSNRSIKNILLDQSIIAGVGNIYASEALFVAKIFPEQKGCELSTKKLTQLLMASQKVMNTALQHRGTSFMSYVDGWGERGDNFSHLFVFAKTNQPCINCQTLISKITQSGRSTFYCKRCQQSLVNRTRNGTSDMI